MKISNISIIMAALSSLFLGGCATISLSPKQQQAITTVSVSSSHLEENAYHEPNARKNPGVATAGGMAGGFLGSLVGSAIDAKTMLNQQKKFREEYGDCFDKIENMMPSDLSARIDDTIELTLQGDDFFGSKLGLEGETCFKSEITYYGLKRSESASPENLTLGFCIYAKISLVRKNDNSIFSTMLMINSPSSYLATEYVEKPDLLGKVFDESLEQLKLDFSEYLDLKLGRKA